jgi:hypothetical protein
MNLIAGVMAISCNEEKPDTTPEFLTNTQWVYSYSSEAGSLTMIFHFTTVTEVITSATVNGVEVKPDIGAYTYNKPKVTIFTGEGKMMNGVVDGNTLTIPSSTLGSLIFIQQ